MTQDELFCSSQRQNQSFDSLEEEDEEIDVGIEDDSDEEVSKNNSKTIKTQIKSFFLPAGMWKLACNGEEVSWSSWVWNRRTPVT